MSRLLTVSSAVSFADSDTLGTGLRHRAEHAVTNPLPALVVPWWFPAHGLVALSAQGLNSPAIGRSLCQRGPLSKNVQVNWSGARGQIYERHDQSFYIILFRSKTTSSLIV